MHLQLDCAVLFLQFELNRVGPAVLGNIVQGFLQNPIDDCFQRGGDVFFTDVDVFMYVDAGEDFLEFPAKPGYGGQNSQVIEDGGAQILYDSSHFLNCFLRPRLLN